MLTVLRKVTRYSTALLILLGILLILVAMVVDLFSPGTTDIVANLSGLINQFIDAGLTGLLTLVALLYVGVLRPFMVLSAVYSAGGINRDMISRVERQNRLDLWFWPSLMIGTWFLVLLSSFIVISPNQGIAIWIVTMGAFLLASFYFR